MAATDLVLDLFEDDVETRVEKHAKILRRHHSRLRQLESRLADEKEEFNHLFLERNILGKTIGDTAMMLDTLTRKGILTASEISEWRDTPPPAPSRSAIERKSPLIPLPDQQAFQSTPIPPTPKRRFRRANALQRRKLLDELNRRAFPR